MFFYPSGAFFRAGYSNYQQCLYYALSYIQWHG